MTAAARIIKPTVCHEMQPLQFKREQCFTEDEGRPLGIGLQELISNHLKLHWSRAIAVSVEGKGGALTLSGADQKDECE
jgi:hypothetical protein